MFNDQASCIFMLLPKTGNIEASSIQQQKIQIEVNTIQFYHRKYETRTIVAN